MDVTYEKPEMEVMMVDCAELLIVSGYDMGGGQVDHGEHTPSSRLLDSFEDEEEE